MTTNLRLWVALSVAIVAAAGPAKAGRVVVDFNTDGDPNYTFTHGYCDLDNVDCTATALPYSVTFSSVTGDTYSFNHVLNYGDGAVMFGDALNFPDGGSEAYSGGYGNPYITGGLDRIVTRDYFGNLAFEQSTAMQVLSNGTIEMTAYFCVSSSSCHNVNYVLDLTPQADGFNER